MIKKRATALVQTVNFYTAAQVAEIFSITSSRVLLLAHSRGLGQRLGARGWVFSDQDIEGMRLRKVGRPPDSSKKLAENSCQNPLHIVPKCDTFIP